MVSPSSTTAQLIEGFESSRVGCFGAIAAAVALISAGTVVQFIAPPSGDVTGGAVANTLGTSLMLTGLLPLGLATFFAVRADRARTAAFLAYPADLRRALRIDEPPRAPSTPATPPSGRLLPSQFPLGFAERR